MRVYHIVPTKSTITWTSQIGGQELTGKLNEVQGDLISELGKVVEGQITIDLRSFELNDPSLSADEIRKIEEAAKSATLMNGNDTTVTYKIEQVIPKKDHELIKGVLMLQDLAFGINVISNFDASEKELRAQGRIQISKSNPVLINELQRMYDKQLQGDKSINTLKINCDLVATEE